MTKEEKDLGRFSDLGIAQNFLAILEEKGFIKPTPIQHQIIPGAIEGKDAIGIAQTGTGKTLAFGIPMIQRIAESKTQGLIVVPTRELALQVAAALTQIGTPLGMRTATIIGGVSQHGQVKSLKKNPHIVIATPGRLADLMKQGLYNLNKVSIITLDEADRMLDVGFLPEIKRILKAAPKDRQILLFSATMPKSISTLASQFMQMPLRIEIAPQGTSAKNVEQEVFVVRKTDKMRLLDSILQDYANDRTIIFSRTKHGAKKMTKKIIQMGHTATEIHGNRSQPQRQKSLAGFSKGTFRVLVATDIAARGIDVKEVSLVINFDLPDNSDDYVHRIGRTGRAGRYGKAISFVTPSEKADVRKIERLIRKSLPVLALPELPPAREPLKQEDRPRGGRPHGGRGRGSRNGGSRNGRSRSRGSKTEDSRDNNRPITGGSKNRFSKKRNSSNNSSSSEQRSSNGPKRRRRRSNQR
jgi:ATP-dependent RNA helicase RhlE